MTRRDEKTCPFNVHFFILSSRATTHPPPAPSAPSSKQPIPPPAPSAPSSKLCQFKSSVGLKVTNNGNIANKKCLLLSAKDQLMNLDLNKDQAVDALTALLLLKVS